MNKQNETNNRIINNEVYNFKDKVTTKLNVERNINIIKYLKYVFTNKKIIIITLFIIGTTITIKLIHQYFFKKEKKEEKTEEINYDEKLINEITEDVIKVYDKKYNKKKKKKQNYNFEDLERYLKNPNYQKKEDENKRKKFNSLLFKHYKKLNKDTPNNNETVQKKLFELFNNENKVLNYGNNFDYNLDNDDYNNVNNDEFKNLINLYTNKS
jgi:transketolase